MDSSGSDDYELMPKEELDNLRREVAILKKNSITDGDKVKILIESMDRLTISMNRIITILDDAEKDIIDEYQKSKPTEKLNQLVEQNEMIARALIALSENINQGNPREVVSMPSMGNNNQFVPRQQFQQNRNAPSNNSNNISIPNRANNMNDMNNINNMNSFGNSNNPISNTMPPIPMNNMNNFDNSRNMNNPNMNPSMTPPLMSISDDLPPMDTLPSLNDPAPFNPAPKKKFLGIM
ncbi:MAG: hypothetical protein ACP5N1_06115 [Candidatus Woesearchaeota archaeon]